MAFHINKEEQMDKFEQDIGLKKNVDDQNASNYKNIKCQYSYNFQQSPLDNALSKEINSLLQQKCSSTLISEMTTECLINKIEQNHKAQIAIAAAGCASSFSSKTYRTKQKQLYRKAGGNVWYDPSMNQWLNDDYRLFVGNLGKEVNDHMLSNPFMQYPSFIKAHVVKNRQTSMTRGCYGFVSFGNSADYLRAIKELNGKYVGSRPMKIEKSKWKKRSIN